MASCCWTLAEKVPHPLLGASTAGFFLCLPTGVHWTLQWILTPCACQSHKGMNTLGGMWGSRCFLTSLGEKILGAIHLLVNSLSNGGYSNFHMSHHLRQTVVAEYITIDNEFNEGDCFNSPIDHGVRDESQLHCMSNTNDCLVTGIIAYTC